MDFWDLTKLMVRRWAIAVPLLILSGALAVLTMNQVKPDYTAMAYVQLVPPTDDASNAGQIGRPTIDQRNPWAGLGLQTLGNAAVVMVTDRRVVDELGEAGYCDSYTLTMDDRIPLVTFEIVGKSEPQTHKTADHLVERFSADVLSLQNAYGVAKNDLITTRRLDQGTNVEESQSKIKRALVAVAGVGVLMTVAVTVGIDTLLRRRQRRRRKASGADGETTPTPTSDPKPESDPDPDPESDPEPEPEPEADPGQGREVTGNTPNG